MPAYVIDIEARIAQAVDAFEKVNKQAGKTASDISRAFEGVKSALELVGVGIGLHAIVDSFKTLIDQADEFNKIAQRTGASVESLSSIAYAAKLSGAEVGDLTTAFKKLAVNMTDLQTSGKIFAALGVSVKNADGSLRGTDDVLRQIAKRFSETQDGANKAAFAVALFGRGGDLLIPMLNNLKALEDEARKLGVVFGTDLARSAEEFNDNMRRLGAVSEAAKISILNDLVPSLVQLTEKLLAAATASKGLFKGLLTFLAVDDEQLAAPTESIRKLTEQLERLKKKKDELDVDKATGFFDKLSRRLQTPEALINQGQIAMTENAIAYLKKLRDAANEANDAIAGQSVGTPKKGALPNVPRKPDAQGLQEQKLYISALQQLENQLGKLNDQTEEEKVKYETTKGSLRSLTEEHKRALLVEARKIDVRKQTIDLIDAEYKHIADLIEIQERAGQIAGDFSASQIQALKDFEFQTGLIGKTADETTRLTKAREIDRAALAAIAQLSTDTDQEQIAAIQKRAELLKSQWSKALDEALAKQRDWKVGAIQAFDEYMDSARNAAQYTHDAFANAFRSLEDVLTTFFSTGKASFGDFVRSVLADMARIQARKLIADTSTGLSLPGLLGFFTGKVSGSDIGSLDLGGGRASGGPVSAGAAYLVGERGPELFMPRVSGTIIPNATAMGGVSVVQNISIDSRSDRAQIRADLEANRRQTIADIHAMTQRGQLSLAR